MPGIVQGSEIQRTKQINLYTPWYLFSSRTAQQQTHENITSWGRLVQWKKTAEEGTESDNKKVKGE